MSWRTVRADMSGCRLRTLSAFGATAAREDVLRRSSWRASRPDPWERCGGGLCEERRPPKGSSLRSAIMSLGLAVGGGKRPVVFGRQPGNVRRACNQTREEAGAAGVSGRGAVRGGGLPVPKGTTCLLLRFRSWREAGPDTSERKGRWLSIGHAVQGRRSCGLPLGADGP